IPLFGPKGVPAWAVLDLLLAVAAVIVAIFAVLLALKRRERGKDGNIYDDPNDDRANGAKKRSLIALIGVILLAVISVVIFLTTQDMSLPMVLTDYWTIVLAVLLAAECTAVRFTGKRKDPREQKA
ncbi:MAG: hypothetical protein LBN35_00580, partial [Clostridiales Family XIII bacterium]|nr:hypothetical protein [Clostridiales Family XIII bacterium]